MGDRAQIAVKQGEGRIYLYSHWDGAGVYKKLADALVFGKSRWSDEEYLTRIIFQKMTGDNKDTTGYGIGLNRHNDIEHDIPVLDCDSQTIDWEDRSGSPTGTKQSFADFSVQTFATD